MVDTASINDDPNFDVFVHQMNPEKRGKIISDFLVFVRERAEDAGTICDQSNLPHDKQLIFRAICEHVAFEKDEQVRNSLGVAAVTLADYQIGVGSTPISALGLGVRDLKGLSAAESAKAILENPNQEKYKAYRSLVDTDLQYFVSEIKAIDQKREQLSSEEQVQVQTTVIGSLAPEIPMDHSTFVDLCDSGATILVDGNISGFFFKTGLISKTETRKQVLLRTISFAMVVAGLALFFFIAWYFALLTIVAGFMTARQANKHAARTVFSESLKHSTIYKLAIERNALRIPAPDGRPKRRSEYVFRK